MVRVLFVCLGNICRSPMAEAVFLSKITELGLQDSVTADSCGTGSWHLGNPPHERTLQVLQSKGIKTAHRGKVIETRDLIDFDYVITMDEQNYRDVSELGNKGMTAQLKRFTDYIPNSRLLEVPDPYYDNKFEAVYELINEAAEGLAHHIQADLQSRGE